MRTRADFVAKRSVIEWAGIRAKVLTVTDVEGGVVLRIRPERVFAEILELELSTDDWVTVVGYSV
jgi:hypothetical protein